MSKNLNFKLGYNWPFPSSPWLLYKNEFKSSAFDTKMTFHSHNFHKKGCALGLIFHLRLLPEFLEFSVEWFAFRKFNRFLNFWKLYYLLLFPNFRKFWSNGKRPLSPISIQGRALVRDVDGFLYSSFKPLPGSTVNILVFSRSTMCPGCGGTPRMWSYWVSCVPRILRSKTFKSFQFYPSFKFKFLLIIQISLDRWIYMHKSESSGANFPGANSPATRKATSIASYQSLGFFSRLDRWNKNLTDFQTEKMWTARKCKNFRKN